MNDDEARKRYEEMLRQLGSQRRPRPPVNTVAQQAKQLVKEIEDYLRGRSKH